MKLPKKTDIILFLILIVLMIPFLASILGMKIYPVISNSMSHWNSDDPEFFEKNYYDFWKLRNYEKSELERFPMSNGFWMGDLAIAKKAENFSLGDVAVMNRWGETVITHRVVGENETHIAIAGDQIFNITETNLIKWANKSEINEKVVFVIPKIGNVFLFFACIENANCDISCFLDPVCLQRSFMMVA